MTIETLSREVHNEDKTFGTDSLATTSPSVTDLHELALQRSIEQEKLGYPVDVEVPRDVIMPRQVGQEVMSALGIRRKLHNRQLDIHPTDDTKMVITSLRNRLY